MRHPTASTQAVRKTVPYRPSNGSDGRSFMRQWCDLCERDAEYRSTGHNSCPIAAAVMIYHADDPNYPPEWIVDEHDVFDTTARCTAFEPEKPND